jgi:hypothetical protein
MDFSECMSKADDPKSCRDYRDDYLECLHHRLEVRVEAHARGSPPVLLPVPVNDGLPLPASHAHQMPLQFQKLNSLFREDKRQRDSAGKEPGGGHGH